MVILFWGIACFGFSLGSLETRFEGFDWSARWNLNSAHSWVFIFENKKNQPFIYFFHSFIGQFWTNGRTKLASHGQLINKWTVKVVRNGPSRFWTAEFSFVTVNFKISWPVHFQPENFRTNYFYISGPSTFSPLDRPDYRDRPLSIWLYNLKTFLVCPLMILNSFF